MISVRSVLQTEKPIILQSVLGGLFLLVILMGPIPVLADGGYYYGQPYDYGNYGYYGYDQPYHDGGYRKPLGPVVWPVATYRSRASSDYYDYGNYDNYYPGGYGQYGYGYGYDDCSYGDCGYYSSSYSSSYYRSQRSYRPTPSYYGGGCSSGYCGGPVNVNVYCGGGNCGQPGYYYDYRGKPWGKG